MFMLMRTGQLRRLRTVRMLLLLRQARNMALVGHNDGIEIMRYDDKVYISHVECASGRQ